MNDKIIGATVGTPISPNKIEEKINPVKTVNGYTPDENGNVEVIGNNGEDGKSAYQIAVENGFEGTEEEWLESLKVGVEIEFATDEEVESILKEQYGETLEDIPDSDFATNDEVEDMLDHIFGK